MKPRRKKPVKEKGTVSTKDLAPTSSLPATESSLPAPQPYFIDKKIQLATSLFKAKITFNIFCDRLFTV
jgi:hypothetical protein